MNPSKALFIFLLLFKILLILRVPVIFSGIKTWWIFRESARPIIVRGLLGMGPPMFGTVFRTAWRSLRTKDWEVGPTLGGVSCKCSLCRFNLKCVCAFDNYLQFVFHFGVLYFKILAALCCFSFVLTRFLQNLHLQPLLLCNVCFLL